GRRAKAAIVPHLLGRPAPVREIAALGLRIVEDCAMAVGTRIEGRPLGSLGDAAVLSFYATKLLATGQGGMLLSRDRRLLALARDLVRYDEREGWRVRWWDFLFYATFGVVITVAVPIAGVLLVFTFLVVPAVIAFLFTRRTISLMTISWAASASASALGLAASFRFDLPTGPLIVCVFGLVLLAAGAVRRVVTASAGQQAGAP
ncbi:MAG: DegT/DnrJ/EryC1/StrS family aminotransferase, partial [Gemmatimonadetes bacterium]|nr:DegT/DnrJ/EryC1/StrS family aminotransferase [Gemmatimonadota bacterium]